MRPAGRLDQSRGELATRRGEVAAYRESLDDLAETERSLAEVTAEADKLRPLLADHSGAYENARRIRPL